MLEILGECARECSVGEAGTRLWLCRAWQCRGEPGESSRLMLLKWLPRKAGAAERVGADPS